MPTCTLIMFIIVRTSYINLPRRHTACRQHRVNVDASHRRRSAPTRRCLNVKCPHLPWYAHCHLDYIYTSTLEEYNVSAASHKLPRNTDVAPAPMRRCLNVKLPHVSFSFTFSPKLCIYAYPGDTSTKAALVY